MADVPMHVVRRPRLHEPPVEYASRTRRQAQVWESTLRRLSQAHPSSFEDLRGACCGK